MSVIRQCECCTGDGSEGKEWFIGAEGEDICARCAVELLGAERDSLRQQLRGAVEALRAIATYAAPPHPEPCGTDACLLCLIHGTAAEGQQP